MTPSLRRIIIGAVFFGLTCVTAVLGYMLAGWNFLDAVYMVVITVFGVGYGETKPLESPVLKVFTMGVIIAGCSSGIYFVGGFVQMLAEGEINRALGTRRMSKGIEKLVGHSIICGYGRVGQMLASDLAAAKHQLVVIDTDAECIAEAQRAGHLTLLGSASEEETLLAAGIDRAQTLTTVLSDDTANVFITMTARDLNPKITIIARAESLSTEKKLLRCGANKVVMPALIGATKIAHLITTPSAEELLATGRGIDHLTEDLKHLGLQLLEIELDAASSLVGRTMADLELSGTTGFVIVAIKKADGTTVVHPGPTVPLSIGDKFMVLGHCETLPQLKQKARRAAVSFRGVTS